MNSEVFGHYLSYLVYLFFCLKLIIEIYLNRHQYYYIQQESKTIPANLEILLNDYDPTKAVKYSRSKLNLGLIGIIQGLIVFIILLPAKGLSFVSNFYIHYFSNEYIQGLAIVCSLSILGAIISLPFEIYYHFVLESKYDFNKMTYKTFFVDKIKNAVLSSLILIPLFCVIVFLMLKVPNYWWILAFTVIMSFQLVLIWAYPKFLAPLFNKFSKLENNAIRTELDEVVQKAKLQFQDYFIMDASKRSSHSNAYFTGIGKNKRIVLFDTLIEKLTVKELGAVMAHELGHLVKRHTIKSITISSFFILSGLWFTFSLLSKKALYAQFGINPKSLSTGLVLYSIVLPILIFPISPLMARWSRKNEFEADDFACQISSKEELSSALFKLNTQNLGILKPSPLYSSYYYSHPPLLERVEAMKAMSKTTS